MENTRVASSDDADARHATSARSCGSAHSCRRTHCFDQARSDLWSVYHEGCHSRFAGVLRQPAQTATRVTGAGDCAVTGEVNTPGSIDRYMYMYMYSKF